MTEDPGHDEIQELLGAYSLGAADEGERAVVEAHLETCESCRSELEDHLRVAEALRRHASRVSPLASAEANGSQGKGEDVAPERRGRRLGVVVATAVVLVIVGGLFAHFQVRSDRLETTMRHIELLERAQLAMADPAAVVTTLRTPGNDPVLSVVSRPGGGNTYATNGSLRPLAPGQGYELWRIKSGTVLPAAALGRRPDVAVFSIPAGVSGFILTVERSPLPRRPTLPAVAVGLIFP